MAPLSSDTCNECAVYFHYERDELGRFVEGGIWYKGFNGPCPPDRGSFQCDSPAERLEANGTWAYGSFDNFIFDFRLNEGLFAAISTAQGRDCSDPTATGGIALQSLELGLTLYRTANTVRTVLQGPADDYAIGCDDNPCPPGFTFDVDAGICVQIVGNVKLPPPPPLPPPCPPGQALDGSGNCVVIDPPVPDLLPNLGEPRTSLNPTARRGPPTPFAMKGCGCGVDDPSEITLNDALQFAGQTPGVPGNPTARRMGASIARVPGLQRRPGRPLAVSIVHKGGSHGQRPHLHGAPTPERHNFAT